MTGGVDLGTIFAGLGDTIMGGITSVAPIAVPVLGALIAIGVGIKVFRKFTGK